MELMSHNEYYTQLCTPFLHSFSPTVSRPRPLLSKEPPLLSCHLIPPQIEWIPISCMEGNHQCMKAAAGPWLLKQQVSSQLGQLFHTSSTQPMSSCTLSCTRVRIQNTALLVFQSKARRFRLDSSSNSLFLPSDVLLVLRDLTGSG